MLLIRLLTIKWTYLVLGAIFLLLGIVTFAGAHPTQAVETDGTIGDYKEITHNGSYNRNELMLDGSNTVYSLDKRTFQPSLPDEVYHHGKVSLWTDQGSTEIVAITLYDQQDANPTKYTTDVYNNPSDMQSNNRNAGVIEMVIGAIPLAIFGVWFVNSMRRRSMQPGAVPAAMSVPQGVPMSVSAPGAQAQPGASQQPGLSTDGKYFWDGGQWRTVSPDRLYWYDGTQWRPVTTR